MWGVQEMIKLALRVLAALMKFGIIKFQAKIDMPDTILAKITKALQDKTLDNYEAGEILEELVKLIKE